jgi:acetylglutamate kinase
MKDVGQRSDRMTEVAGLKHALPYLRLFQGKTFVVKLSGEAIEEEARLLLFLEQIEVLHRLGIRVVLVHGGGLRRPRSPTVWASRRRRSTAVG